MNVGYVRVSTEGQNEGRQVETMRSLGIKDRYIYIDKSTGKNFDRPQYQAMRLMLREGDCLYIDSLDRLGRDYDKILEEWNFLTKEVKCDIICLDMKDVFNTTKFKEMGDIGKVMETMMLSMLSYVAEIELKKNHERQRQGIELAKKLGKYKGRKPIECNNFEEYAQMWVDGKITLSEAYTLCKISKATFMRRCKEYGYSKTN